MKTHIEKYTLFSVFLPNPKSVLLVLCPDSPWPLLAPSFFSILWFWTPALIKLMLEVTSFGWKTSLCLHLVWWGRDQCCSPGATLYPPLAPLVRVCHCCGLAAGVAYSRFSHKWGRWGTTIISEVKTCPPTMLSPGL